MSFHRNAKLGLGGRFALVCAIEGGLSLRGAADRFNVSPAIAHRWWSRWREAGEESRARLSVCSTARAGRTALRASSQPSCRSGSVLADAQRVGGRGLSRGRPVSLTRRSGRCCAGPASHARRGRPRSRPTATSGHAPVIYCTWMSLATPASSGLATVSPVIARSVRVAGRARRPGLATTMRTRSSMTTRGLLTLSSTPTNEPKL